jgi:hypothetical protein
VELDFDSNCATAAFATAAASVAAATAAAVPALPSTNIDDLPASVADEQVWTKQPALSTAIAASASMTMSTFSGGSSSAGSGTKSGESKRR